jgi:hypothetical protein
MSGDSASQLRAIRSGEYRIPGCNHADTGLKRPAPEGQRSSLPVRICGCSACRARCLPGRPTGQSWSATRCITWAILDPLQAYGLADRVGADRLFPTLPTAEAAYRAWESEQAGGRHRPPAGRRPVGRAG